MTTPGGQKKRRRVDGKPSYLKLATKLGVFNAAKEAREIIAAIDAERLRLEAEAARTLDKRKRTRLLNKAERYAQGVADGYEYLAKYKRFKQA